MNCYQIFILACLLLIASSSFVNTTEFWKKALGVNATHYECYSGIKLIIKVMKKSTGTIPEGNQECIIAYSLHPAKVSSYLIRGFL